MHRIWKQLAIATNWPVLAAIAVLLTLGITSIYFDPRADVRKHLVFVGIGFAVMALFQAVNYQRIGRLAWPFYIFSLLLLIYTAAPGVPERGPGGFGGVPTINGARRWINFGPMSLQPSELMKIAFVLLLARYLRFRSNYRTFLGLLAPFMLAVVPLIVILKQPDLGTALVFIPVLFAMLFVAGAKIGHLLAVVGMAVAMAPILWLSGTCAVATCTICPETPGLKHLPQFVRHYQRARVHAMLSSDPATLQATGYQQHQALIAMGSGQISGKGAGMIPVGRFVPEAHNDMVFVLIGEQFGYFGSMMVLAAYMVLFAAGIEIAAGTREPFGRLVALGTVAMLAGQAFINIMVVMRMMPATGLTLPFVSYGGSSLLPSFIAAGLLLNIGQDRPLVIAREAFEY